MNLHVSDQVLAITTYKHQACAFFGSYINVPSEIEKSYIYIHTTLYKYEHESFTEYLVRSYGYSHKGCVLDMGMTTVYSDDDSQELIDKVFKVLFISTSGCNMYVKGELTCEPSDSLPVYPKQIVASDD